MTSALLERPLADEVTPCPQLAGLPPVATLAEGGAAAGGRATAGTSDAGTGWVRWIKLGAGVMLAAGAVLLGLQLRSAHLSSVLASAQPWQLAAACGWIALSLVAAAYNLTGFSAVRVPLRRSLLVQLAVSGLRVITPSAVSTPVVATRFLTRSGASLSDASATVGVAQAIQLIATGAVMAGLAAVSGASGPGLPSASTLGVGALIAAVVAAAAWLAAQRSARVRSALLQVRGSAAQLLRHARYHPGRVLGGVAASAALTLTHMLAFAACVAAAGGHAPVFTLAAVYLGAATAGSLIPTPGGIGGVEATLIAGLTAAGLSVPVATAATLLSRLTAVWLPAVPGWWAVLRLRRAGLL
jgi:uncharacterized membrane protein YbhN (UPF0104 family)